MDFAMIVSPVAKAVLAALLLPAGIAKLWDRQGFVDVVRNFAILPGFAVRPFALGLPVAEVVIGVALLSNVIFDWFITAWAGTAAMGLFGMFSLAITINLIRGRTDISCGCFGRNSRRLTWGLVGRAFFCVAVGVLTVPVLHHGTASVTSLSDRLNAALIGVALVAISWLARFIVAGGSVPLESRP